MNLHRKDVFDVELDPEEKAIENALPDTWDALPFAENMAEELSLAKEAASNYFRKDTPINIRLSRYDIIIKFISYIRWDATCKYRLRRSFLSPTCSVKPRIFLQSCQMGHGISSASCVIMY